MDTRNLIEVLRATMDQNQRQQAEEQLSQIHKIIGFAPSLLQVVMMNDVPIPVRLAGVENLKNLITSGWDDKELQVEPLPFTIPEQDQAMVRDSIVYAITKAPHTIRVQLQSCLKIILTRDCPKHWKQIVDKINIHFQHPEPNSWMGALMCLYHLINIYEYDLEEENNEPLIEAMNLLLPILCSMIVNLQSDQSMESVLIQKQILKCFYALILRTLPLDLMTKEVFTKWMEVLRAVMDQPIPDHTLQVDEAERVKLPWWKCKKWAVKTLYTLMERYGSPGNTRTEYEEFAKWYLTTFTGGILEVLLRVLDQYRNKVYVSPRVLQQTISYITECVSYAHSWKLLKPHMFAIIQDVLLPLIMSHSEADDELWNTDPHKYIRIKRMNDGDRQIRILQGRNPLLTLSTQLLHLLLLEFYFFKNGPSLYLEEPKLDIDEDCLLPVTAAQGLLQSCSKKRKEMLERTMQLCMRVLTSQSGEYGPRQRDGALHIMGTLSDLLTKNKFYKGQIDLLLSQYVFPEFHNPLGYIRARAYSVLQCFTISGFKSEPFLSEGVRLTVNALLNDTDLPVKAQAAFALLTLLNLQETVHKLLEPQVKAVTTQLLRLIRETENNDIANVLQQIVTLYTEQLMPMAYDITEHLATTFRKVIESDWEADDNYAIAIRTLHMMKTVLNVMKNNPEIMAQLEKPVLTVVGYMLHHHITDGEPMTLLCYLTDKQISEDMWKVLELLYQVFEKESFDYFTDMMPVLHNYITVDTNAFVSNENHILAMFNMAKAVLNSGTDEELEMYAAKLLEVMVLQCNGKMDNCLPSFVELVVNHLTRKVNSSALRTMLLQVLIAILCCNPVLLFTILDKLQESVPNASFTQHFIKQWIHDTNCFKGLHDRKLCVLGICSLLEMGPARPSLEAVLPQMMPSCLVLFNGLKREYKERAKADKASENDDDDEDEEVLSSDEDDINMARMANMTHFEDYDDSDEDDDDREPIETELEYYTTPLDGKDCHVDEYVKFKTALTGISSTEPALYHALTSVLNEQQQKQLSAVLVLADQRKAQQDSKRIEQSGGYSFTVTAQVHNSS